MTSLKKGILLVLMCIATISCSKEETTIISTSDLTVSIDENSAQGTVIGTVEGMSNTGAVTFNITVQSPNGAMAIDATTGELTILDATVFDFETNPEITATIEVADGEAKENASVTVNLNDVVECKNCIKLN